MRNDFIDELCAAAATDERVLLLTADLGFSVVEGFAERFPDRFVNVGVAEQNLIGVATGLARDGYVPFVYSIATFASMRPYEFIRNGPVLHELPVRIIGTGGGVDYGHGGVTHFALEDVAILRSQPDLAVIVPADACQARAALRASFGVQGPVYFRIGRQAPAIAALDRALTFGYRIGSLWTTGDPAPEVVLFAIGPVASEALDAARLLRATGTRVAVGVVSSFNPFPSAEAGGFAGQAQLAVSVEAHYRTGGLGSALAEALVDRGVGTPLLRLGVTDMPRGFAGSPEYLLERFGLTAPAIEQAARLALEERRRRARYLAA